MGNWIFRSLLHLSSYKVKFTFHQLLPTLTNASVFSREFMAMCKTCILRNKFREDMSEIKIVEL